MLVLSIRIHLDAVLNWKVAKLFTNPKENKHSAQFKDPSCVGLVGLGRKQSNIFTVWKNHLDPQ